MLVITIRKPKLRLRAWFKAFTKKTGVLTLAGLHAFLPVISVLSTLIAGGFLFAPKVSADSFYSTGGDPFYCAFGGTFGVQYSSLGGGGISYNGGDVQGQGAGWMQSTPVNSVTAINGFYGDRYSPGNTVAVPPNSTVEIGYWAWNLSGHHVNIYGVDLFTSRPNPAEGDITRLGAGGSMATSCNNVGGCRTGKRIQFGGQGGFGADPAGNSGGRVVYSFTTIQPIQQQSFTATPTYSGGNLTVNYALTLRNTSTYNVGNIRVVDNLPSGGTFDQTFSFNAGETRTINWSDNMGTSYPGTLTNNARVYDNNTYSESTARPKSNPFDTSLDAQAGLIYRDDLDAPSGWNAAQGVWASDQFSTFTVRIIPYNFASSNVSLDLAPNIQVEKLVSDSDETNVSANTALNQEEITYTINVSNTGGRSGTYNIVDNYDQNYLSIIDADGGTDNGDTITWSIPPMEAGGTTSFSVRARINELAHGDYTIINTVTSPDDSSSTTTEVHPRANIDLNKLVSDSDESNLTVNRIQGQHFNDSERLVTFTLNYANVGDADATNAILTDNLSEFEDAGILDDVFNISNAGTIDLNTNIITWNLGTLDNGETGSVSFQIQLDRYAGDTLNLVNRSRLTTNEVPPEESNTTTEVLTPELTIEKTDGLTNASTGDTLSYTVTIRNTGNGNAYNLEVEDSLPDYFTVNIESISDGGYFPIPRRVKWEENQIPQGISLNAGDSIVLTFTGTLDQIMPLGITDITNFARVWAPEIPTIETNDVTQVEALPELEIEKYIVNLTAQQDGRDNSGSGVTNEYGADANTWLDDSNDVITYAGDELLYTIMFRNIGDAHSPDTFVADHLPRYILDENGDQYEIIRLEDFVSIDEDLTPVANGGGWDIVWDIGELPVSETYQVRQFVVRINPERNALLSQEDTQRLIDNVSEIYSENDLVQPDSDNALARVDIPILRLEKVQDLPDNVAPGEPIVYTLNFSNIGSGDANNVTLTDSIPEHALFVQIVDTDTEITGVYNPETNSVTWDLGTLEPLETGSVSFMVVIGIPTQSGTEIRNTGVLYNPLTGETASETITAIVNACCLSGTVWDDNNKNGVKDSDEYTIDGALVTIEIAQTEYLPARTIEITSGTNGVFQHRGIPYNTPITVTIQMPSGYDEFTTPQTYQLVMLPPRPDGVHEDYIENGIRYITAENCINFLNAGIYRDIIIADTGDSILVPIGLGIALIGAGVTMIILTLRKRKK